MKFTQMFLRLVNQTLVHNFKKYIRFPVPLPAPPTLGNSSTASTQSQWGRPRSCCRSRRCCCCCCPFSRLSGRWDTRETLKTPSSQGMSSLCLPRWGVSGCGRCGPGRGWREDRRCSNWIKREIYYGYFKVKVEFLPADSTGMAGQEKTTDI